MNRPNEKPLAGGRGAGIEHKGNRAYLAAVSALYAKPASRIPDNWRSRLPDASAYYRQHVQKMGKVNATGWAKGACPFHEDRNASLSVNLAGERGLWRCFASCGGGDLVSFHQRRTGLDFKAAVRDLIGGGR